MRVYTHTHGVYVGKALKTQGFSKTGNTAGAIPRGASLCFARKKFYKIFRKLQKTLDTIYHM
jgi:hypothetical protein